MIPQAYITAWGQHVPWQTPEQIEQDLVICRALVQIFNDPLLATSLAFRGGTALNKLYLQPQPRYSEDIDLVQITAGPFGPLIDRLRDVLDFLGRPQIKSKNNNTTLVFKFESEFPPVQTLRLKVETNCREHFSALGWHYADFAVESDWYQGSCQLTTYYLAELLGTKLRALYQRRKGRDLFDLHRALTTTAVDPAQIVACFQQYMAAEESTVSQQQFLDNLTDKMENVGFLGDTTALLRPVEAYNPQQAYVLVRNRLLSLL